VLHPVVAAALRAGKSLGEQLLEFGGADEVAEQQARPQAAAEQHVIANPPSKLHRFPGAGESSFLLAGVPPDEA
jgi:hypothetical protein